MPHKESGTRRRTESPYGDACSEPNPDPTAGAVLAIPGAELGMRGGVGGSDERVDDMDVLQQERGSE